MKTIKSSTCLMVFFLAVLGVQIGSQWIGMEWVSAVDENRRLAPHPGGFPKDLRAWVSDANAYYTDHFAQRRLLLRLHALITYGLLHTPGNPSVLLGKKGRLFMSSEGCLLDCRHAIAMEDSSAQEWSREF